MRRLIDGAALRERLSRTVESFIEIGDLLDVIDAAPTIDAEPVVHAQWEIIPGQRDPRDIWVKCSKCGNATTTRFSSEYDYCPYCGARMDAEENGR